MSRSFEKCSNCGAPLETAPDGRSVACEYCGAGAPREVDPAALAASLQAESRSVDQLFDGLARRLAAAFPDLVAVQTSGGFFSAKRPTALEISVPDALYRMTRRGRQVVAERADLVRGIAVKTEPLPVDAWIRSLCEALSAMAGASAQAHDALRRFASGS